MADFLQKLNQNQRSTQFSVFPSQQPPSQPNPFAFNNSQFQSNNPSTVNINPPNQFTSQSVIIPQNLTSLINPTSSLPSSNTVVTGQAYDSSYDHSIHYLHNKEIFNILQAFLISLDTKNPANAFKYMMYNNIPENLRKTLQAAVFKRYYPYQRNADGSFNCIDYLLWQKALKFNPNSELLYPTQLSSPGQLKERAEKDEQMQLALLKTLKMSKELIEKSKESYESSINNQLSLIKQKRMLIKVKMCSISKQISSIAMLQGKARKDVELENTINAKLKELKRKLGDKADLMLKLNKISSCPVDVFYPNEQFAIEQTQMTEERLAKSTQALNDLRSLVNFASSNIKKNLMTVQGIQTDLEYYKTNGCFKDK